ncbi:MAG: hypothetical protein UT55_C0068G0006 [Candidatus Peregrinibacteria bacterium GW2011_GWE2_39_6]|nr:MAG: hypothetical protein UT55_C0068G0006 [Candidatus Peregrinibacteria bacterium GW2011_GWE2_39_6]
MNHLIKKRSLSRQVMATEASALIIALLLMGFLVVLGLGMSKIIVDSIRVESNVVDAGKSYFAAEAGIERGLYYHENNLSGFEIEESFNFRAQNQAQATYKIIAQEERVPCLHRPEEWRSLGLQESVSWSLFRWDENLGRVEIKDFDLAYFVDRSEAQFKGVNGNVLRWKILGIRGGATQSISGILPYDSGMSPNHLEESDDANFYEGQSGGTFFNDPHYPIIQFLENHQFNTLILTNVVELANQADPLVQLPELNEYALIEGNGILGGALQSLDVQVQRDSALPVYDFALYQTE